MFFKNNVLRRAALAANIFILAAVGCTPKSLTEKARANGNIQISGEGYVEEPSPETAFKRIMTPYEKIEGITQEFSAPATASVAPESLEEIVGEPPLTTEEKKEKLKDKEYDVKYHYYEDKMYVEVDGKIVQLMYIFEEGKPYRELNEFLTLFDIVPGSQIKYVNDDNPAIMQCVDVNDTVYQLMVNFNYSTDGSPKNAIITYDRDYEIVSPFTRSRG